MLSPIKDPTTWTGTALQARGDYFLIYFLDLLQTSIPFLHLMAFYWYHLFCQAMFNHNHPWQHLKSSLQLVQTEPSFPIPEHCLPLPNLNSLPQLAQFNPLDYFFFPLPPLSTLSHLLSFPPSFPLPFALQLCNLWPSFLWCWSLFVFIHPCIPSLLHPFPNLFKAPVADTLSALEQHMTLLAVVLSLAAVPKLSEALLRMMRSCCVPSKSQLIALAPDHVTPVDDSCQI